MAARGSRCSQKNNNAPRFSCLCSRPSAQAFQYEGEGLRPLTCSVRSSSSWPMSQLTVMWGAATDSQRREASGATQPDSSTGEAREKSRLQS